MKQLGQLQNRILDKNSQIFGFLGLTGSMAASSASSDDLLGRLREWANSSASKTALSFLDDAADVVVAMSYGDLARRSDVLAYHLLQQEGLAVGDRVLLVYPPSLDFVVAFLACLKAGLVAVPTYPPDPRKLNKDLKMFATVAASCGATAALTSAAYNYATKLGSLQAAFASLGGVGYWPDKLKWVVTDAPLASAASLLVIQQRVLEESQARQNVAFLQYTSGSTSDPKGVVITKENLTDNLLLITTGLAAGHDTVVVSWLPQYHDMGLIGAYLGLLYCGGSGYYLSPLAFVRNPVLWVRAMSRYRATHVQAPNFAYALTARKFLVAQTTAAAKGAPALDLSSLRHMINAGTRATHGHCHPSFPTVSFHVFFRRCHFFQRSPWRPQRLTCFMASLSSMVCAAASFSRRTAWPNTRCTFAATGASVWWWTSTRWRPSAWCVCWTRAKSSFCSRPTAARPTTAAAVARPTACSRSSWSAAENRPSPPA